MEGCKGWKPQGDANQAAWAGRVTHQRAAQEESASALGGQQPGGTQGGQHSRKPSLQTLCGSIAPASQAGRPLLCTRLHTESLVDEMSMLAVHMEQALWDHSSQGFTWEAAAPGGHTAGARTVPVGVSAGVACKISANNLSHNT